MRDKICNSDRLKPFACNLTRMSVNRQTKSY